MILESELLPMSAEEVAAAIRHRMQLLAEKARPTRDERGEVLRELQQLRARYVYLRGGAAAVAELV